MPIQTPRTSVTSSGLPIQVKRLVQKEYLSSGDGSESLTQPLSNAIVILLTTCLTFVNMLQSFSNSGVTVMLDEIADDLRITENNLQWIINSFQLPLGCFILVAGKSADIFGRKKIFTIGITFSAIWTLVAGFMKKELVFYVCRALAGVANALITGSNIGILVENTAPAKLRSLMIGICISGLPFGGALGFTVAGILADAAGWRSIFYLTAGLSLLPLIGVLLLAPHRKENGEHVDRRIDWTGGLLFTSGSVLLFFCLSQSDSEPSGWRTPYIIALLVNSLVLLLSGVVWISYLERKTGYPPIMRISIVTRNRGKVGVVYFVAFCCISCYAGLMYTSNILYQRYEDLQPTQLMFRYLPGPVVGTVCNIGVGLLAAKVSGIWFMVVGSLSTGIANVLYAVMDEKASYWTYQFFAQATCVVGPDLSVAIGYIYITSLVESWEVAIAGASLQFFVALAFVCGPSFSTLIYKRHVMTKHGSQLIEEESRKNGDLLESLRVSFWFWAALCFTSTILTMLFLRDMGKTNGKNESNVAQGVLVPGTTQRASGTLGIASEGVTSGSGVCEKDRIV